MLSYYQRHVPHTRQPYVPIVIKLNHSIGYTNINRHNCGAKLNLKKGGQSPPSVPHAQSINYYDILHRVPCSPLCRALTCTHKYSPLQSTLPCSHMYSYLQSLAVHSAIPCSPLCHALLFTQIVQMAEYLRNPPVA